MHGFGLALWQLCCSCWQGSHLLESWSWSFKCIHMLYVAGTCLQPSEYEYPQEATRKITSCNAWLSSKWQQRTVRFLDETQGQNFFPLVYLDTIVKSFLVSFVSWIWLDVLMPCCEKMNLIWEITIQWKPNPALHTTSQMSSTTLKNSHAQLQGIFFATGIWLCHDIGKKPLYFASFFFHVPIFISVLTLTF